MNARKAAQLLAKRRALKIVIDPEQFLTACFPQQLAFIKDPAHLKTLFCTRRAAKSFTAGLYLIYEAIQNPGCNCLFIGLTRESAKNIIWKDILKVLNLQFKLNARFNETSLSMTLPNGSIIRATGIDAGEDEMKKLLGGKYRLACLDEGSMYQVNVRDLVYGILKPAMTDPNSKGQRGTICLMGTSSNFARGLFYDITTGKETGWSVHTWSALDNPHVATQWAEELAEIQEKRPLYMETPQFKQWYLNQWAVDDEKRVYRFDEKRNIYTDLPKLKPEGWTKVLGVDIGWEDDNAFVLTAYHENDPNLYVLKSFAKKHMTFDAVVKQIEHYMKDPEWAPNSVIIDGANKQGVESMRQRSAIPFVYADKQGKVDFIEIMNSDFIQGKIKLPRGDKELQEELMGLVWKTDGDKIRLPKTEHGGCPNHRCDAFLYAWRKGYHYNATDAKKIIPQGSKEWYQEQSEGIWERERERLEAEAEATTGGWPSGGDWGSYS